MHAQVITYRLKDLSPEEFSKLCETLAPVVADQPGLIAKVWLANPETNTYGGMYTWRDRQSMEAFMQSDLVKSFASHPSIVGLASQDFAVDDAATRITRGMAVVTA
jgi:quinol monooxygenase YgiN